MKDVLIGAAALFFGIPLAGLAIYGGLVLWAILFRLIREAFRR